VFRRVTALELDRSSVVRGGRDAERLGVRNLDFVHADARKLAALPDAELIAVDPPRAGLAKATRGAITASGANRLLYVSCDVATWARDVAEFEAAGWSLSRVQPFDFYPQTHHIELLSLLTRS
jgi:23S rRNA (uracil1939-C5)-methyltransferase